MWFRCFLLFFCLTAICAQKGGRQSSASDPSPSVQRSPSRVLAQRKGYPQPSEPIQQVQEPDRDPDEDKTVVSGVRPSRPLPRPLPQPSEVEGHEPAPEPYSFSYQVDDPETGAASSREETQDANGEIIGYYHIKDADGRTRRVDYTAGKDGFKATIKSNEEGLNARAPADVNIELSPSPSEPRASWAPNNRPTGAESSIKNFGKPPTERFYQKLVPPPPAPVPAPSDPQPIEQVPEKTEDSQISQTYESDPSDPAEITQQRNVEEVPFESAPVKGPAPAVAAPAPAPLPIQTYRPLQPIQSPPAVFDVTPKVTPIERPVGTFTPQRSITFREQGSVSLQPVLNPQPITQIKEEIPNTIQDYQPIVKPLAPVAVSPPIPQTPVFRPLSPILGGAQLNVAPVKPVGSFTPSFSQFFHSGQVPSTRPVQPVQTYNPPLNNIIVQQSEHRTPISQEQLLNILHPQTINPGQTITIDQTPQLLNVHPHEYKLPPTNQVYQTIETPSVSYVPQPPQPPRPLSQDVITQERITEEPAQPTIQSGVKSESKILETRPLVNQHFLPTIRTQPHYHYQPLLPTFAQQLAQRQPVPQPIQPLPSPPQPLPAVSQPLPSPPRPLPAPQVEQKQESFDEPQVYEPQTASASQEYDPLQQEAEDPAEESRSAPPPETVCDCAKKTAESRSDPVKGGASESVPAPVKGGRLESPARSYIPQAFSSR